MTQFVVTARLDQATSVQETSKLFEGLNSLERQGHIRFSIAVERARASYPRVVGLAVARDGVSRQIAIDLSDERWLVHLPDLERADLYFKRSLWPEALAELSPQLIGKIRPFGLNNPQIRLSTAAKLVSARHAAKVGARQLWTDARQLLALPTPQSFECPPDRPAEQLVLFQTRVWEPPNADPLTTAINEERVALVTALRRAFGDRFLGGLVPTPFAQKHYPGAITRLPFSMRSYARLLKKPLVAVYSRGLHDSIAFKMGEYLAASRAIVGHKPQAVLPRQLAEGFNYLSFSGPDECVANCDRLLSNPEAAGAMRRSNWEYYLDQVEPAKQLLNVLQRAFDDSADAQQVS
jgi:hypothetical protein